MPSKPEPSSPFLLSPSAYDDDVASLKSLSDQDSDSEDDEILKGNRSTLEIAKHDRTVLEEEEEMENLLVRKGPADGLRRMFSPTSGPVRIGKKERQRRRREAKAKRMRGRQKPYQEGDLMFEMEEGFRDETDDSSTSSWELDRKELDGWQHKQVRGTTRQLSPSQIAEILSRQGKAYVYDSRSSSLPSSSYSSSSSWLPTKRPAIYDPQMSRPRSSPTVQHSLHRRL
jgi:hypothetical protein